MPCRCDYLEPTARERGSLAVREFLKEVGYAVKRSGPYGNVDKLDEDTAKLCSFLKAQSKEVISGLSLELQIWWRDHQKADAARKQREEVQRKQVRERALSKLSEEELRALGVKKGRDW